MKSSYLYLLVIVLVFSSHCLKAQHEFIEDDIRFIEVVHLDQFAQLNCKIKPGTDNWEELPEILKSLLEGDISSALAGCYGKRGRKKCKQTGGLCVKSSVVEFDSEGYLQRLVGGLTDENGNYTETPTEGRLYYGLDEYGEMVITFRSLN